MLKQKTEPVGLILAGGKSSRMGFDKSLLFTTQLYKMLRKVVSRVFFSLAPTQGNEAFYEDKQVIKDEILQGPMSGIYTALRDLQEPVLALACDMPFVDDSCLRLLLEKRAKEATVFECEGFVQPLVGIYELSLIDPLYRILAQEQAPRSLNKFLQTIPANIIALSSENTRLFVNINTCQDLRKYLKGIE